MEGARAKLLLVEETNFKPTTKQEEDFNKLGNASALKTVFESHITCGCCHGVRGLFQGITTK
eukprot:6391228-Amphidinium_carterae.1